VYVEDDILSNMIGILWVKCFFQPFDQGDQPYLRHFMMEKLKKNHQYPFYSMMWSQVLGVVQVKIKPFL